MITGDTVALRPVAASDLPGMRRWFDDPETMRHWGIPRPFVLERQFEHDLDGRFSGYERAGYFTILDPDSEPIGRIDYDEVDELNRSCEIGILIGEADARNKRYGSDAIIALLRHLFRDRGMHRVALTVLEWNERAIRAYRRIGFQQEGLLRDHRFADGRYVSELQMSMLDREFDQFHPS
jgi:RimJ/RimL family protein N-acetyltransferase